MLVPEGVLEPWTPQGVFCCEFTVKCIIPELRLVGGAEFRSPALPQMCELSVPQRLTVKAS